MNRLHRAALFARTVRHLRPGQFAHRARLRTQKLALTRFPGPLATRLSRSLPQNPGWPERFEPLDARLAGATATNATAEASANGRFSFLGEERALGDHQDWEQPQADQLWRYNLHYFEWAWPLVTHPDRPWARAAFGRLWHSWQLGTTFGRWDAWSPYVVSLRAWALCGLYGPLIQGTEHENPYLDDLALHGGFVRANLELDVGGNHLVKNIKALVGLGVFLADDALVDLATRHLTRQLPVQVLSDGGHFERSPSYHCQVLGDLIDISEILKAAGRPAPAQLGTAIASMRTWLGAMLLPDGDVPLFNDCTRVGPELLALLEPVPAPPGEQRLTVLQPSGYAVIRTANGRIHLVADIGPPCPPELPAHAHADCLSFELAVDGQRLVVDTGTSTYRPGPRRDYERSTAAHNTVEIDGDNQTEVWGAFRAARRATPRLETATDEGPGQPVTVTASHNGYERLPGAPRHRRTWRVTDDGIEITDEVEGNGEHTSVARLILAPGTQVQPVGENSYRAGPLEISLSSGSDLGSVEVAEVFGKSQLTLCLSISTRGPLPHRIRIRLALGEEPEL
ncbi:MAG TPA: alginate lyase family protein [Acidimicrobiales bacterium]|nr:alginate lyase family protein [Acidimicrobiales bacterium]